MCPTRMCSATRPGHFPGVPESLQACHKPTRKEDEKYSMSPLKETFGLAASSELASYISIPGTGPLYSSVSGSSSTMMRVPRSHPVSNPNRHRFYGNRRN